MSDDDWSAELPQDKKSNKFYTKLREHSVSQEDPIPEWTVVHEVEGDGATHCICSTPIVYQYTIENKLNGRRLTIGSECVKRWGVEFVCKKCGSPLGNITRRLIKKEFLCPDCKKEEQRRQRYEEAVKEEQKAKLGKYILFWYGKYYQKKFSEVIDDVEYVNYLINYEPKNKTLEAFEEYVNLCYQVVLISEETA